MNKLKPNWLTLKITIPLVILLLLSLISVVLLINTNKPNLIIGRNILVIVASTLIAGLISIGITISWEQSKFPLQKQLKLWLRNLINIFGLILFVIGITLPALYFLFTGSLDLLADYIGELTLSIVIIFPIYAGWMVLQRISVSKEVDYYEVLLHRAEQINTQVSVVNNLYEEALRDFNLEKISESHFNEFEQTLSLMKWIVFDDKTGYYELREEVEYGRGLDPKPYSIMEKQLEVLRHEQNGKRQQLEDLINLVPA